MYNTRFMDTWDEVKAVGGDTKTFTSFEVKVNDYLSPTGYNINCQWHSYCTPLKAFLL